jgi:hypothetical protein
MFKNTKAQSNFVLITGLVFGIASLIIGVIISFVIISTLSGANLLQSGRTTVTVTNESGYINQTGYTLSGSTASRLLSNSFTLTALYNRTSGLPIALGNATVSSAGVVTNKTSVIWNNASISYTYTLKTYEEISTDALGANFTAGVDNVSGKIPTVLLVAAIVLILGILVLLVSVWQKMRVGGSGI